MEINRTTAQGAGDSLSTSDDSDESIEATARAGSAAAADALVGAKSADETHQAARDHARTAADAATQAKIATATAVASAASSVARIAAETAAVVADEAAARAAGAASSAATARDAVAATLPDLVSPADAQRAAEVALTVAFDLLARAAETKNAAVLVARAVTSAAAAASIAAQRAATSVEQATEAAAASAQVVSELSAESQVHAEAIVGSTARFADLGLLLRAAAAVRRTRARGNETLVAQLQEGLARSQFRLHYQPIYGMQTGAIIGMEALIRWQHPTRGLLAPAEFIAVAESHPALVNPVGDWVLAAAVAQSMAWRSTHGTRPPRIWVNVSCEQLGSRRLSSVIAAILDAAGADGTAIGVEVTERQLIETTGVAAADLAGLRDLDIPLALDDFGTGYASLEYLRRFTFDEIKIDGTFVSGLGRDRTDTAVVSSVIELGRILELAVVAEGVETDQQYELLRRLGCDSAQGYLLARPADVEVMGELLNA